MPIQETLLSVAVIWTVAAITPGPNFFITVQTAMAKSRRTALMVAFGITSGTVVWGIAGFMGVSALFVITPLVYTTLKLVGGAYLAYIGIRLFIGSLRSRTAISESSSSRGPGNWSAWRTGFFTILANPKTAAFVVSLFAATLPMEPPAWMGAASVSVMAVVSITWYALASVVFSTNRVSAAYRSCQHWINRVAGGLFVAFGIRVATQP